CPPMGRALPGGEMEQPVQSLRLRLAVEVEGMPAAVDDDKALRRLAERGNQRVIVHRAGTVNMRAAQRVEQALWLRRQLPAFEVQAVGEMRLAERRLGRGAQHDAAAEQAG